MNEPTIRWAAGGDDVAGALAVRERVFCGEQGVALEEEQDGRDGEALHLVAVAPGDGRVVGTLRVLREGEVAKIGRVAVERAWRRRGLALSMLRLALARAAQEGCTRARLAAQVNAIELYRKAGFAVQSEPFEEAGIIHVWMATRLPGSRSPGLRPARGGR